MAKVIEANILVPPECVEGSSVNCYRILDDPEGKGYLVDWMWFEESEDADADCAIVISRVRIPVDLMKTFMADASKIGSLDMSGLKIRFDEVAG